MRELVKIDQLTVEDLSASYKVDTLGKTEKEIHYLKDKMVQVAKASLVIAFEMGRRLVAVKETLNHGEFLPWLEQNFELAERTARRYMALYEHFKERPSTMLEDLTIQEAYVMAGTKKAINPTAIDGPEPLEFAGEHDAEADRSRMRAVFKKPTLSGAKLVNHRVENVNGIIYVYRKDVGTVAPAMDLYVACPPGLPKPDWFEMQESFVIATELYLEKIEAYESQGRIEAPEDRRMLTIVRKTEEKKTKSIEEAV